MENEKGYGKQEKSWEIRIYTEKKKLHGREDNTRKNEKTRKIPTEEQVTGREKKTTK